MDPRLLELNFTKCLGSLADLAMPRLCIVCGAALLPSERHVCLCCLSDLPQTLFELRTRNPMADSLNAQVDQDGYEPYSYASALFFYNADSQYANITRNLKYRRTFAQGRFFASMLGKRLAGADHFRNVDAVVPVPLHWTRKWKRGYNQAEIIAREVASALGAPCLPGMLKRVRRTATQTRLSGRAKTENVAGAFRADVPGRQFHHILLVDDVYTTGSTLAACHRALRAALGPGVRISAATLGFVGD